MTTHTLEEQTENGEGFTLKCSCGEFEVTSLVKVKAESKFAAHVGLANARESIVKGRR